MSLTTELKSEVQRLIREGNKSGAIEFLRSKLNISTLDASTLADAAEIEITLNDNVPPAPNDETALPEDLAIQVKALLLADQKIEAVKLVRQRQNISLAEALKHVEEVERLTGPDFGSSATAGTRRQPFSLVGKIFTSIGIFLTIIALYIFYTKQDTISKSQPGIGYVTDFAYSDGGSAPRIEYQWNGKAYSYQSNVYTTPPAYSLGEKVDLYINSRNPSDVVVNSFTGRWLAVTIVAGIGIFFFCFGILFIFVSGKF